jgi:hypothetical protein
MTYTNPEKLHNGHCNENRRTHKYALIFFFGFSCITVQAQIIDSAKSETQHPAAEQFPPIRALQVQYENLGKRNFSSKLYHQPFQQGKVENESRLSVDANIPLYLKPRYIVTAALKYNSDNLKFSDVAVKNPNETDFKQPMQQNFQYFSATESFTYFSSLFHRPAIYNANLIIDGNQHNLKRVYGFVSTILEIKNSKYTTISVGVIGFIDPAAVIPAAPILAMRLSFRQSAWWVDCMLPRYIMLKSPLSRTARLSLGSELNGNIFYVNPSDKALSTTYQFNQFELRTGATYDQQISKHFILSFRGGYQHILFAQLAPINQSISDYVYQTKPDGTLYYNIGLSYNIFKHKPKKTQKFY